MFELYFFFPPPPPLSSFPNHYSWVWFNSISEVPMMDYTTKRDWLIVGAFHMSSAIQWFELFLFRLGFQDIWPGGTYFLSLHSLFTPWLLLWRWPLTFLVYYCIPSRFIKSSFKLPLFCFTWCPQLLHHHFRGKSFISGKLSRYLHFRGMTSKIFHIGCLEELLHWKTVHFIPRHYLPFSIKFWKGGQLWKIHWSSKGPVVTVFQADCFRTIPS